MTDAEILKLMLLESSCEQGLEEWLSTRPECIKEAVKKWPPYQPYEVIKEVCPRLPIGSVVSFEGFFESGRCRVVVLRSTKSHDGTTHVINPEGVLKPYKLQTTASA